MRALHELKHVRRLDVSLRRHRWTSLYPPANPIARWREIERLYVHQQRLGSEVVQELRREGGRFLKDLREQRGLSQRQLAAQVGADDYTFISQLETGRGRVPPDRDRIWADALGVDVRDFVRSLMRFYDPQTFEILFGD